jgi:hypothetical protein
MAKKRKPHSARKTAARKKKATPKKKAAATKKRAPKPKAAPRPKRKVPMVGATFAASAAPPYKCQTTLESGVCLRFNRNPATGQYNLPPGGIRVSCTDCEYFFD